VTGLLNDPEDLGVGPSNIQGHHLETGKHDLPGDRLLEPEDGLDHVPALPGKFGMSPGQAQHVQEIFFGDRRPC